MSSENGEVIGADAASLEELRRIARGLAREVSSVRECLFRTACDLPERLWRYRRARLDGIERGDTPVRFADGPRLILHLVPHSALNQPEAAVDVQAATFLIFGSGGTHTYNANGKVIWPEQRDERQRGYAQLYRSGCIEAAKVLRRNGNAQPVYVMHIEVDVIRGTKEYLQALDKAGVTGPVQVAVTLTGTSGLIIRGGERYDASRYDWLPIQTDELAIPPVQIHLAPVSETELAKLLRPALDVLWQAGGWQRCPSFNQKGDYEPR